MIEIIPNYHPIFVHFTLGLLGSSIGLFIITRFVMREDLKQQLLTVALWNLWLGAVLTIVTIGAGWYAFNTVKHDDAAHVVMLEHRNLALITLVVVLILAVWAWRKFRNMQEVSFPFLAVAILSAGLLVATAWEGAELVFRHGLGVIALPNPDEHHHHEGVHEHDNNTLMNNDIDHMDEYSDEEDHHHDD